MPPAELPQATLRVQVLDFKRFSRHEPLGELSLPLGTVDLRHVLELWHQLGPPGTTEVRLLTTWHRPSPAWCASRETEPLPCPQAEQAGELCFSVRYVPSSGWLTVVVLEARGLSLGQAGESRPCVPRVGRRGRAWLTGLSLPPTPVACPEAYVKVQLVLSRRKWKTRKTSARKGTVTPYFNEAFAFRVPFRQIQVGCLEEGAAGPRWGPS